MRIIKLSPLAVLPMLLACSDLSGGSTALPSDLTAMCVGTVSSDAKNSAVDVRLSEFLAVMANNGFVAGWSGSSTAGVLTLRKDDKFAGKTTEFEFETEQRPYVGSITACQPNVAVLVRAKLDGELLGAFASEDAALTIAQQAQKARPAAASTPSPTMVEPSTIPAIAQPAVTPVDGDPDPDADALEPGDDEAPPAPEAGLEYLYPSTNAM
ncbi:hypothetical protein F1C10_11510 [Sphingomonas sp. NBWT7]|uniref:hypothetical protein n=1 Tax=Sphingomonas sp. NBWT7 TaxID=2596913 RepID=UPI001624D4E0|nr:hypothetical protein [Sphingomonas sp. NBWT7]QNE32511.1 hypothetical protein F1C10_11510 [Sphingomonas sp. NBWT7]